MLPLGFTCTLKAIRAPILSDLLLVRFGCLQLEMPAIRRCCGRGGVVSGLQPEKLTLPHLSVLGYPGSSQRNLSTRALGSKNATSYPHQVWVRLRNDQGVHFPVVRTAGCVPHP